MRVNNTSVFVGGDTTSTGHSEQSNTSDIGGRPTVDDTELSPEGVSSRENDKAEKTKANG